MAMALAIGGTLMFFPVHSSILNLPGESTLRRDFLRLQLANKERSEALRRQQLEQQQRENEEHKRQLLAERQKRIEEQKEQRRRLEEVSTTEPRQLPQGWGTTCLMHVLFEKKCDKKRLTLPSEWGQGFRPSNHLLTPLTGTCPDHLIKIATPSS